MELLVQPGMKKAKTLSAEILSLKTSVAGFCESWKEQNLVYAYEQSDMAFRSLDHIQNELLRIRDDKKTDANWQTDSFKQALDLKVGHVLAGVTPQEKVQFSNAKNGAGCLPNSAQITDLTLEVALNKLKHKSNDKVNFKIDDQLGHILYIFTNAGCGQPDSISEIHFKEFCDAANKAEQAV
ncbi:TPA: hypothetical protein NGU14_004504 [Vibrio parahaemolyticus]|nr:hypothetical protein [Vibrio parahaemolyticus]HCG8456196.1 hypothetical protein [Vibrio parahaemolyticus]